MIIDYLFCRNGIMSDSLVPEPEFCLWFRASLIYINNCPMRCNTKQPTYYSASSLYMFRESTTPIIRSTQNCNYSLQYWSYFLCSNVPQTWPTCRIINGLLYVVSHWTFIYTDQNLKFQLC